jgi:hypothetical protein
MKILSHILGVCVTYKRGLGRMSGFNNNVYTRLETTGNYSATAVLDTLQLTVTHEAEFSVFTNHILATDL